MENAASAIGEDPSPLAARHVGLRTSEDVLAYGLPRFQMIRVVVRLCVVLLWGPSATVSGAVAACLQDGDVGEDRDPVCLLQGDVRVTAGPHAGTERVRSALAPDVASDANRGLLTVPSASETSGAAQTRADTDVNGMRGGALLASNATAPSNATKVALFPEIITLPTNKGVILAFLAPPLLVAIFCYFPYILRATRMAALEATEPERSVASEPSSADSPDAKALGVAGTWAQSFRQILFIVPFAIVLGLGQGVIGPSQEFISMNFYAKEHYEAMGPVAGGGYQCDLNTQFPACRAAVDDLVRIRMITGSISPLVVVVVAPALGVLSDAYGRKRLMLACVILNFIPTIFCACYMYGQMSLRVSIWSFFFHCAPLEAIQIAYVADIVTDPRFLGPMLGVLNAVVALSSLIGMVIGRAFSIQAAFAISLGLGVLGILMIACFPESLPVGLRKKLRVSQLLPGFTLDILVRTAALRRLCLIVVLATFVDSGFNRICGPYMAVYFNWNKDANTTFQMIQTVMTMLFMGFGVRPLVSLLGDSGALALGRWSTIIQTLGFFVAWENWQLFLLCGLLTGPAVITSILIQSLKSRLVSVSEQGVLQGSLGTATAISAALGPLFFGAMYEARGGPHNSNKLDSVSLVLVFVLTIGAIALGAIATLPQHLTRLRGCEGESLPKKVKQ